MSPFVAGTAMAVATCVRRLHLGTAPGAHCVFKLCATLSAVLLSLAALLSRPLLHSDQYMLDLSPGHRLPARTGRVVLQSLFDLVVLVGEASASHICTVGGRQRQQAQSTQVQFHTPQIGPSIVGGSRLDLMDLHSDPAPFNLHPPLDQDQGHPQVQQYLASV